MEKKWDCWGMRNRGGVLVDTRLKHRIKQYLSNSGSQYVDIGILAADLQRLYSLDYGRRKRNAFRIQVDKVFRLIRSEIPDFEEEHLMKRSRMSHEDDGADLISDSSDSEDYPEYPPTNHMNSSLLSLYRKSQPDPSPPPTPPPPARKVSEGGGLPGQAAPGEVSLSGRTPAGGGVSVGGWFIDRAPGADQSETIVVDLCVDEKETGESSQVIVTLFFQTNGYALIKIPPMFQECLTLIVLIPPLVVVCLGSLRCELQESSRFWAHTMGRGCLSGVLLFALVN
uniref:nuclear valosin-containing protein-like n=1 Tax=Pristiophorus japonicus TaxID=55135 RepID=UPI00398EE615